MADLTGIENVGDFFSQHYLAELLEKDLASESGDLAAAIEAAQKALGGLGRELNRIATEAPLHSAPRHLYTLAHPFQVQLCEALGFTYQSGGVLSLGDTLAVPALHLTERHGEVYLAVLEGRLRTAKEIENGAFLDVFWEVPLPPKAREAGLSLPPDTTLGEVIAHAFEVESPPRWVLLLSGAEVVLAERARWGRGQYLRFDLSELLGRRDPRALEITAALLCRASLVPDGGALLHDRLDESSHKHAQGVSADLKFAAREAVELLANEWVHYQRTTAKKALHGERVARELTEECLVYLYRLLVLFYVEARSGELGLLPMNSDEYARGYSLEALRDLEQVTLGPESRDGYFFDESLRRLFRLVNEGFSGARQLSLTLSSGSGSRGGGGAGGEKAGDEGRDQRGFRIEGLHSPLFDARSTPRLSKVRLRNEVLQKVVRLLSLTPEARRGRGAKMWGRGRISYAQLGINQLGAVYEGLLSYTGFFARERLYEVHRAGDAGKDATQQAWFIPESELVRYTDEELLFDEGGPPGPLGAQKKRRKHEPGTFIYRLAGRDRESSASYYTPEVLTRCLVKYALRELLQGKTADDILALSICEPAMGSGAFLVEAIDQLADAYLERRRKELGAIGLPPDEYALEKQKVKSYLAEARCYGVDLNPMAAKLAGVSLWLATLHRDQPTPWYGARLAVGNSLVGARLEVWAAEDFGTDEPVGRALAITAKKHGEADDLEAQLGVVLAAHEGKHPEAVAEVRSRVERAKRLAGAGAEGEEGAEEGAESEASEAEQAAVQRKEVVKVLKKLASELKLPRHHRRPPRKVEAKAVTLGERPAGSVWHFLVPDAGMSPFESDKVVAELAPDAVKRLKEWRKDIEEPWSGVDVRRLQALSARVDSLYAEYAAERQRVLETCTPSPDVWTGEGLKKGLPPLEKRAELLAGLKQPGKAYARLAKVMDLWAALWAFPLEHSALLPKRESWLRAVEDALGVESGERAPEPGQMMLGIWPTDEEDDAGEEGEGEGKKGAVTLWTAAEQACARLRPLHWELVFPEVFVKGGGFDLVVGNPPWIRVEWNEKGPLQDYDPRVMLDALNAGDIAKRRTSILNTEERAQQYLTELTATNGYGAFLEALTNYPLLQRLRTNLYKCFLVRGWAIAAPTGEVGLIHQDGLFDEPQGGTLRRAANERLSLVLRFKHEIPLFDGVDNQRTFTMTVSRSRRTADVRFQVINNLYHPATVDACMGHDGSGVVPGIKTDAGNFEVRGHRLRVIEVTERDLALFAGMFDVPGTPALESRLPSIHSELELLVLRKLADYPHRLQDLGERAFGTRMWHETDGPRNGIIRRETRFVSSTLELILNGPHFYVGTPLYKTPRAQCFHNKHYDTVDHLAMDADYLPRTNYLPACPTDEYEGRAPTFRDVPMTRFYRHVHRCMLAVGGERTLISAIVPPGVAHVHTVISVATDPLIELVAFEAFAESLLVDFLVRTKGGMSLHAANTLLLPVPAKSGTARSPLSARALRLNCLTTHYADLWNEVWPQVSSAPAWSSPDPRLSPWPSPAATWQRSSALRNHFERRWALVEIDALAALELKLTIDELCTIYRTQFPVLREYEKNTWYDRNGRIAFTTNRGLTGVGLERKAFELWQQCLADNKPLPHDFDRQNLEPPFDLREREDDMRTAYTFFAERLASSAALTIATPPAVFSAPAVPLASPAPAASAAAPAPPGPKTPRKKVTRT